MSVVALPHFTQAQAKQKQGLQKPEPQKPEPQKPEPQTQEMQNPVELHPSVVPLPPVQRPPSPPLMSSVNGPKQDLSDLPSHSAVLSSHAAVLPSHAAVLPSHPPHMVRFHCYVVAVALSSILQ